jgi:hypothetical protein
MGKRVSPQVPEDEDDGVVLVEVTVLSTSRTTCEGTPSDRLPTLVLEALYARPLADVAVSGAVAEELVRTPVTSSSLVLTIPLTTLVAALLAGTSGGRGARPRT